MSDNSVPPRLSYAGAAKLAHSRTTPSTSSTSVSGSKPAGVKEEYPSLVPATASSHQSQTTSVNNTTSQSNEGKVSPRRWETINTEKENTAVAVTEALQPVAPICSKSVSHTVMTPSSSNDGVSAASADPKVAPPADPKVAPPADPKQQQSMQTRWADLLKKPSSSDQLKDPNQSQNLCGSRDSSKLDQTANHSSSTQIALPVHELHTSREDEPVAQEIGEQPPLACGVQDADIEVSGGPLAFNDSVQCSAAGAAVDKFPGMPPPMYPVNPQYGFMVPAPQYVPQAMGGNYFVPNPYYQPMGAVQMPYQQQQPFYNGIFAEQRMDGSVVFRYPHFYDNDGMYPANNQTQQCQQPVFEQIPAMVPIPDEQPAPPTSRRDDSWNNAVVKMEEAHKIREKINLLIADRYRVLQKINMGSCGSIYTALDTESGDNTVVAVKFEIYKEAESHLLYEYEVYKKCSSYVDEDGEVKGKPTEGFGNVLWMGTQFGYRILVMQLLGPSLENLFGYSFNKFSPETTYKLGMQMIDRIEHLHNCGYVHRDMKPDNFVVGLDKNENTVFLLDFGLARPLIVSRNNQPNYRKGKGLVGTAKYASVNSHNGLELSPRDDMESICYILLEFITGDVPWKDRSKKPKHTYYNRMRQIKEEYNWEHFCSDLAPWMEYVRTLEFNDKPDYKNFRCYLRLYLERSRSMPKSPLNDHLAQMNLGDPCRKRDQQRKTRRTNYRNTTNNNSLSAGSSKTDQTQLTVEQRLEQNTFEWVVRRTSSLNENYTYQCLFVWTLPYGTEPDRPPDRNPSMQFGYGFGEGGYA